MENKDVLKTPKFIGVLTMAVLRNLLSQTVFPNGFKASAVERTKELFAKQVEILKSRQLLFERFVSHPSDLKLETKLEVEMIFTAQSLNNELESPKGK